MIQTHFVRPPDFDLADFWVGWDTFERIEEAQTYVLGMGASVDIIAPEELRIRVLKLATEVVAHYSR